LQKLASAILMYLRTGSQTFCAPSNLIVSLPPPTFRERHHCGLARLGITWVATRGGSYATRLAVCRRAVLVVPEGERPHPRRSDRRRVHLKDAFSSARFLSAMRHCSTNALNWI
jgi:hypothetical protein